MAEMYISRMTGIPLAELRAEREPLILAPRSCLCFKKRSDTESHEVRAAAAIAEQIARGIVEAVDAPPFAGTQTPGQARRSILDLRQTVTLSGLVDFAWRHGIIVAHIVELPKDSKKFIGIALYVGDRPVVLLASGRNAPAWLAFHLAHELGHVLLQHVYSGSDAVEDIEIDADSNAPIEAAANRFALELLTGNTAMDFKPIYGLTGQRLAAEAQQHGPKHGIDPGVLALAYGWSAGRLPAAQRALQILRDTDGAHETIADGLRRHLREDLPESLRMLANLVVEA